MPAPAPLQKSSPALSGSGGTAGPLNLDRLLARFPTLDRFLGSFDAGLGPLHRAFLRAYVGGQLAMGHRTTLRSLAREVGVSGTFLGNLFRDPSWDEQELKTILQDHLRKSHRGKQVSGLIFESECFGFGNRMQGAVPQTSREAARPGDPTTLIHLGLSDRRLRQVMDSELYVPPEETGEKWGWDSMGSSTRPPYRSRSAVALELLDRAKRRNIRFEWLLLNKGYGGDPSFLLALADRGQRFIAEIPPEFLAWVAPPLPSESWNSGSSESPSLLGYPGETPRPALPVRDLVRGVPLPDHFRSRSKGEASSADHWHVGVLPLYPSHKGLPAAAFGLLALRHRTSGETKFFLSNGFLGVPLRRLADTSLSRHSIECQLREDIERSGLAHMRVRGQVALRRHVVLSLIALLYRSQHGGMDPATVPPAASAGRSAVSTDAF